MPAVVAALWLYGYASHVLLSKYLISVRTTGQEKNTSLILIQIWSLAKLVCGLIDYGLVCRSRRRDLGELLSTISDGNVYNPVERIYTTTSHCPGKNQLPSFGLESQPAPSARRAPTGIHGRAFASITDGSEEDDEKAEEGTLEDVPLKIVEHLSDVETFTDCTMGPKLCLARWCGAGENSVARSFTREPGTESQDSVLSTYLNDHLPQLVSRDIKWRCFSWFVQGWLELAALSLSFLAIRWTFVGDCQTHRYWTVVFIAVMQMFLAEETLNHSVMGVSLIVTGLIAKVIFGTMMPSKHFSPPSRLFSAGGHSAYSETTLGAYLAFTAGVVYSLQTFLHELSVELSPASGGYKCLIPEAAGALYLSWSMYPLLIETGATDVALGLANLREHWAVTLWYTTSCLVAVIASVLQRRYSSPFSRSVAFILQLPIVYFTETVILRWHVWRVFDVSIIIIFLLGFSTMTATWPTTILGSHVHDFLYQRAFVKPRFMIRVAEMFTSFLSTFRGPFRPKMANSFNN